jgi:hypothetical protein
MNKLNEIRIKLTEFGMQSLRKDKNLDLPSLINNTAKELLALCNEPSEPERWRPKKGEAYWMIQNDGDVETHQYADDTYDDKKRDFGNCFKTREQAEQARDDIKKLLDNVHRLYGT